MRNLPRIRNGKRPCVWRSAAHGSAKSLSRRSTSPAPRSPDSDENFRMVARELAAALRANKSEHVHRLGVEGIARGMPPAEAAAAARRKFGNPGLVREEIYRMNTIGWLEGTWQDLRYGLRTLRLSPGFAAVAIVSLALGIGANTAIFQLLDAVRLRSLPVRNPQELAEMKIVGGNHALGMNQQYGELTRPIWQLLHDKQQAFSGVFAWSANQRYVGQG